MPTVITNPIAEFHLVGDPDDPSGVEAVATFYGEEGAQVEMRFSRRGLSGSLAALLFECEVDLHVGQTKGIMEVVARKGEAPPADGEPLTLYELLRLHELGRPAQHEDPDEVP